MVDNTQDSDVELKTKDVDADEKLNTVNEIDVSSSLQSPLETYLREINETKLLTADEEKQLAGAIALGDVRARDRMVRANLRLVVNIARGYTGKGLGLQDLIEEGNLGLLRAVEGFDPNVGTRFSTYASYWIKQSIKRALINSAKTIRIPAYMVELSFENGGRAKQSLDRGPWANANARGDHATSLGLPKKKAPDHQKKRFAYTTRPPQNGSIRSRLVAGAR